jgi:hypothetical protein
VNNLPSSHEEMIPKPLGYGNFDELMNETSAGERKNHTATNRQPRMQQMKLHENGWNCRRYERMKEIDNIRCIGPIEHKLGNSGKKVFQ